MSPYLRYARSNQLRPAWLRGSVAAWPCLANVVVARPDSRDLAEREGMGSRRAPITGRTFRRDGERDIPRAPCATGDKTRSHGPVGARICPKG